MKTRLFQFSVVQTLLLLLSSSSQILAQYPDYRSWDDGFWDDYYIWEQNDGTGWGGEQELTGPSKESNVFIISNITIRENSAECNHLNIEEGSTLNSTNKSPNFFSLRPGSRLESRIGIPAEIVNNGTLGSTTPGAANDGISLEIPYNCNDLVIYGTGKTNIYRVRPFMSGETFIRGMNFTFDQNITISGFFTAFADTINNKSNDSISYTIMADRIVKVNGYFHSKSASAVNAGGKYIYNINGTLDLSGSTLPSYIPGISGSVTTLNITGDLKLGSGGLNVGAGNVINLNGGVVDATKTTGSITGPVPFTITGTASVKRTVGATDVNFPVATTTTGFNQVILNNKGTSDVFTVSVKDGFDNALPFTARVNKQWTVTESNVGGSSVIVKLYWLTADQVGGFNPEGPVNIIRYNGSSWDEIPATVTGTGTTADPYIATSNNPVTAFSSFGVANSTALPVTFSNAKAFQKNSGIEVEWVSSTEINISKYIIERSIDGQSFTDVGSVDATGNSSVEKTYSWFDATPNTGNNFYRIKAIDKDGSIRYTSIMKVAISKGKADFAISPNPVHGNQVTLHLNNLEKGIYLLSLYNNGGQKVLSRQIVHRAGSAAEMLQLPSSVKEGMYSIQIRGNGVNISKSIIVK